MTGSVCARVMCDVCMHFSPFTIMHMSLYSLIHHVACSLLRVHTSTMAHFTSSLCSSYMRVQLLSDMAVVEQQPPQPPHQHGLSLMDSVRSVDFLDAGLNCRGAHITDPSVTAGLGQRCRRGVPLSVGLHGTPRQWSDRRRPFVKQEKDR